MDFYLNLAVLLVTFFLIFRIVKDMITIVHEIKDERKAKKKSVDSRALHGL